MKTWKIYLIPLMAMAVISWCIIPAQAEEKGTAPEVLQVSSGKSVSLHYTLTVDGKVVDSSRERDPLKFLAGSSQVIPGFEKAVTGMKVGEKKSFKISPEEGYGNRDPKAIREISRDKLPADLKPEAGMTLYAKGMNGQPVAVKVMEVKKDSVMMDFNHPLAGKMLNFDVEIMAIQ